MDPFYGEIRMMAFDYPPESWAFCNGQPIPIQQNPALYSVIGTLYGGNSTSFNLPNLTQKVAMGMGAGPGLTPRQIAATAGEPTVTLNAAQMPPHTHGVTAIGAAATAAIPNGGKIAQGMATSGPTTGRARKLYNPMPNPANQAQINTALAPFTGGGGAHSNMQPSLTLNFCICLYGDYPIRP